MADDKWMNVQEVLNYLGVARSTLDLYVRQNRLKRFQSGAPKRTMYLREAVVKLKNEVKPK